MAFPVSTEVFVVLKIQLGRLLEMSVYVHHCFCLKYPGLSVEKEST